MRFLIPLLTIAAMAMPASACDTLQTFRSFRAPAYAPCDCGTVLQAPVYAPQVFAAPVYAPQAFFAPSYAPSCGVLQAPVYAPAFAPVYHAPAFRAFAAPVYAPAFAPAVIQRTVIQRRGLLGFGLFDGNRTVIRERAVIGGGARISVRAGFGLRF